MPLPLENSSTGSRYASNKTVGVVGSNDAAHSVEMSNFSSDSGDVL